MIKAGHGHFLLLLMLALSGCAPPGVPRDASRNWSLEEGSYWTWRRPANSGCLSWLAVKDWASVQLLVDKPCETVPEGGFSGGKGLSYFSVEDHLIFNGYWPWSPEIYNKLVVYDDRGMFVRTLPCPNSLTQDEIAKMQATAVAAAATAVTKAEKQVITRISARLTRVERSALSARQEGCSDWHDGEDGRQQVDPWKPESQSS